MARRPDGVRYCFELDAIHEDLDWLLSELDTDVDVRYKNQPDLMRNAVVYHVHNYHYRIHAYRDKVAQLLNACLDLGERERTLRAESVLKAMGRNSERRAIHDLLSGLINDKSVKDIVDRRNAIAHRKLLVDESGTWQVVTAERRAREHCDFGESARRLTTRS
jgi:Cthe_2314-like HEPN